MAKRRKNPLTDDDLKKINAILRDIHDKLPLIHTMEQCGIECQEQKETLADLTDRLQKIRATFFPSAALGE